MFQAGYLFKPSHTDIHYVREGHGLPGADYGENFTRNVVEAKSFATQGEAADSILSLLMECDRDPEYCWTPVTIDTETGCVAKMLLHQFYE